MPEPHTSAREGADVIVRDANAGTLGIHGLDDEQRAVLGFLARYGNPKTRGNYELDLRMFHAWCRQHDLLTMLAADSTHIQLYVRHLEDRGLAASTVNRRVGTVRGLFRHAVRNDLVVKDPTLDVTTPKVDQEAQYRTWLSTLEFAALLKEARKDPRNHAMVAALGLLGLRVSEMCSLDVESIHREIGEVYVTFIGKGTRHARMQLPFEVLQAFDTYRADRVIGPLFLTREGLRWTPADVRRVLTTLAKHTGIERRITPHGLRRTLARLLQERGVELGAIQQTMRHKDPRVTVACYIGNDGSVADIARQTAAAVVAGMAS